MFEQDLDLVMNPQSIMNLLTLRYNPNQPSLIPKLTWQDFTEDSSNNSDSRVEQILKETIRRQINELNVKSICVSLSGGIDSGIMLALLRELFPEMKIDCVSVGFNDIYDETTKAAVIAETCNANFYPVYVNNPLKDLPKQIHIVQEPRWNLYWYYALEKAVSLSHVILSGDGGDELFGGYTFRYQKFLETLKDSTWKERAKLYVDCHERDWVPDQHLVFGKKINFSWDSILDQFEPYFNNSLSPLGQVFLADFNGKLLFDWMPTDKKLCQYFGMNLVAPILTKEVISYATHIPYNLKYDSKNKLGKIILRMILERRRGFDKTLGEKQGFGIDVVRLWTGEGRGIVETYLEKARILDDGWINKGWVTSAFEKLKQNIDTRYINKMFLILALEIWYELFVTEEITPNKTL